MKIALVEDNSDLRKELLYQLEYNGFDIVAFENGISYLKWLGKDIPHELLILDLGLPDIDGLIIAEALCKVVPAPEIIILTARSTLADRINGWNAGAKTYLTKPFEFDELLAIIRSFNRKLSSNITSHPNAFTLDLDQFLATDLSGKAISVSFIEAQILSSLIRNQPDFVSRTQIIGDIGLEAKNYDMRRLETNVSRLRKKLLELGDGKATIRAVRGKGYIITGYWEIA